VKVINIIQDLATPHNNVLIEQFKAHGDVQINLWYVQEMDHSRYQWKNDITHEHFHAQLYGNTFNWRFLLYCLTHSEELFVIVGWMNINTRILHLLFFILRRPYNHWTDLPKPKGSQMSPKERIFRWIAYQILRHSKSKVFCVGQLTIDRLRSWGFPASKLVNLPIFVSVDEDLDAYRLRRKEFFSRYGLADHGFLVSSGSRLIYEKGYDLLIQAVSRLPSEIRADLKVVIVGSGDELATLESCVSRMNLGDCVFFEKWLAIEDFKGLIANSDVFIHPARFDAFGGTIFAMALGVPVIGSSGAGAAVDRIQHGCNGILYETDDTKALADAILKLYREPDLKRSMGQAARNTAINWHPKRGAEILIDNSI
jgi:glycosyltransferase involved in cell wall biosynthesis